jgi:sugar lactone lactonase YvrE
MGAEHGLMPLAAGFGLLEAARWYPSAGLVFSDMTRGGVYALADDGPPRQLMAHRKAIGGLVAHADGGYVVSGRNIAHKYEDGAALQTVSLAELAADERFFNDLTADGSGRLYAGSVARRVEGSPDGGGPSGRLYRIDPDGTRAVLADDVLVSNGLGTDRADRFLYHADSGRQVVWRFALDAAAVRRDAFVDTREYPGVPDGLAVGADGSVWVALAGGGAVVGWDARGARLAEYEVPAALVTCVCFGGPRLDVLYILTGSNEEFPEREGGRIFRMAAPCVGLPAPLARI